ncbi:MAG: integrase core domain-containing protein [Steroidobacteraceae bacterium]
MQDRGGQCTGTLRRPRVASAVDRSALSAAHLRLALKTWISHYNRGRPHMALVSRSPGSASDFC